jgi:hypothetical protein
MRWPVTEPPDSRKLRWLPVAAVGVAGLAAVAAVAACRRKVTEEPALPEAPPPPPDRRRFDGGLWTVLPDEKPGSRRPSQSPLSPAPSLPPETRGFRWFRIIFLTIVAILVSWWVALQVYEAGYDHGHSSNVDYSPLSPIERMPRY